MLRLSSLAFLSFSLFQFTFDVANQVDLCWVPVHSGIVEYEYAETAMLQPVLIDKGE